MDMEPTYFLFSGKLFHAEALASIRKPGRGEDATPEPSPPPRRGETATSTRPQPRRGEDPGPEGPEGEPVGEDDEDDAIETTRNPAPGPGEPLIPEHGSPDANAIDPRIFEKA
jgi:hypothetical protein